MNEKTMMDEIKRNNFRRPHGLARAIAGNGCVIAWWESGENESLPSIKASAVSRGEGRWSGSFSDGAFHAELEMSGGSMHKVRGICMHLVKAMRGVKGRKARRRINKGLLLEASRPAPLTPGEELAATVARQKEAE